VPISSVHKISALRSAKGSRQTYRISTTVQPQFAVQAQFECSWHDCNRTANQTRSPIVVQWQSACSRVNCLVCSAICGWIAVEIRFVCLVYFWLQNQFFFENYKESKNVLFSGTIKIIRSQSINNITQNAALN
jgi:hypothetical protein